VYCEPKSRMTIDCSSTDDFLLYVGGKQTLPLMNTDERGSSIIQKAKQI
jgi:hypothetical protein